MVVLHVRLYGTVTFLFKEPRMGSTVDVIIPVDAEAARALQSSARREAAGRYLSVLLKAGRICDVLAETIAEAKQ